LRVKAGGEAVFFRPPEHDRDRTIVIGISRFVVCFGVVVTGISLLKKSVDRYGGKLVDEFSSI